MNKRSRLDRDKVREALLTMLNKWYENEAAPVMELLEACVLPDPRIARIEAWVEDTDDGGPVFLDHLRAILRGDA